MNTIVYFTFTLGGYFLFVLTIIGLWFYYNRNSQRSTHNAHSPIASSTAIS